jgi:hypothetical protein
MTPPLTLTATGSSTRSIRLSACDSNPNRYTPRLELRISLFPATKLPLLIATKRAPQPGDLSSRCDQHRDPACPDARLAHGREANALVFWLTEGRQLAQVFLIGSPVIRICSKPFIFSINPESNRHKIRCSDPERLCGMASSTTAFLWSAAILRRFSISAASRPVGDQSVGQQPALLSAKRLIGSPPDAASIGILRPTPLSFGWPKGASWLKRFLIGSPVIRIRSKSFEISTDSDPNRCKKGSNEFRISIFDGHRLPPRGSPSMMELRSLNGGI